MSKARHVRDNIPPGLVTGMPAVVGDVVFVEWLTPSLLQPVKYPGQLVYTRLLTVYLSVL